MTKPWSEKRSRDIESARASLERKSPEAINAKRAEADRRRAEHEQFWLEEERRKYGAVKLGRPLSKMPV